MASSSPIGKITEHAGQCGRLIVTGEDIAAALAAGSSVCEVWQELNAVLTAADWGMQGSGEQHVSFEAARQRAGEPLPRPRRFQGQA
jgi:hypothetical protein